MAHLHIAPLGWTFWITIVVLWSYWIAQIVAASGRNMFTLNQLRSLNKTRCLVFIRHFACMWSYPSVFSFFLAYIAQRYWVGWREFPEIVVISLLAGHVLGAKMEWKWARGGMEESHTELPAKLPSSVGIILMLQIGLVSGILIMFVLSGLMEMLTWRIFFGGLGICAFHFLLANHWPVRLKKLPWTPQELKPLSRSNAAGTLIMSAALLFGGYWLLLTSP